MISECKQMSGADIAKELGITRQAVSSSIRKSMRKMYRHILNDGTAESPFQAIIVLMEILKVNSNSIDDVKMFLKMFDKDIIESVTKDASMTYNIDN